MIEDQFLRAAFHHYVDRFTPVTMPPAAFPGCVLFRQILRIVNQHVSASSQPAHVFVENRIAGFVIGSVDEDAIFRFQAIPHAALRMIEPGRLHGNVIQLDLPLLQVVKIALRFHLVSVYWEIWRCHLFFHHTL